MPTNKEVFESWEQTSSRTTVHILTLERGDESAANRLTLTDKPYLDKGVAGAKYHDTYPAPIHSILSNLQTSESRSNTTIKDIILANGDGKFDSILTEQNIIGNSFTMLIGDQSWSLLETDYPYKFVEAFRGKISGVLPTKGGAEIRLSLSPIDHDLGIRLGVEGEPRGYGRCFNVPFQLNDSATHQYIGSSYSARGTNTALFLRDNGVDLVHPDDVGPDYSLVLSGTRWKGTVQLGSAPTGKVTGDINVNYANNAFELVRRVLGNTVSETIELGVTQSLDASAVGNVFVMLDGELTYYIADGGGANGTIYRYALSPAGDLTTSSGGGSTYNLYNDIGYLNGMWVDAGEDRLYVVGGDGGVTNLYLFDFGTTADPSTLSLSETYALGSISSSGPIDLKLSADESKIWIMFLDETIHQLSQATAGDLSSVTVDNISQDLSVYDRQAWGFEIADSGKRLYVVGGSENTVFQFDLITANTIEDIVYAHRQQHHFHSIDSIDPYALHVSSTDLYVWNETSFINKSPLASSYNLPRAVFLHNVFDGQAEVDVGVWYSKPTPSGTVISDIIKSIACSFSINRIGEISAIQLKDPESAASYEPTYKIYFGDFIGSDYDYLNPVRIIKPARKVTQSYKKNFSTQSADGLGGSLTEDEVFDYSTPERHYTKTNSLASYVESEDVFIDGFVSVSDANSQAIADGQATVRATARSEWDLKLNLRCISLLDDFRLGSIIEVAGDWRNPNFADGDKLQVIGREINWSTRSQKLRVFK